MHQSLGVVVSHIRAVAGTSAAAADSDQDLLIRFTEGRDQAALAALVQRHGAMVWGVCRRLLRQEADADEAFQATFLVLLRKATSIRRRQSLASWLYGVAYRVADRVRSRESRQTPMPRQSVDRRQQDPALAAAWRELCTVLDEEVQSLSYKHRAPIVLCYLEGRTRDQAARELGWSLRTLDRRLVDGRALLRTRLTRRGLTLSAALLGLLLAEEGASAVVPGTLVSATLVAGWLARTAAGVANLAETPATFLARSTLRAVLFSKLRMYAALLCCLMGVAGLGAALVLPHSHEEGPSGVPSDQATPPPEKATAGPRLDRYGDPLPPEALWRLGTVRLRHKSDVVGAVFGAGGKVLATRGYDSEIRLWDPASGVQLRTLDHGYYETLAVSPDGKALSTAGISAGILWEVETGKKLRVIRRETIPQSLNGGWLMQQVPPVFSPDGKYLAWIAGEASVRLWEVSSGRETCRFPGESNPIHFLGFAADGKSVLSVIGQPNEDTVVSWWDPATGKESRKIQIRMPDFHYGNCPRPLAVSPDGKMLALAGSERARRKIPGGIMAFTEYRIHLWDLLSNRERLRLDGSEDPVRFACFTPDSMNVAGMSNGGSLTIWNATTGRRVFQQAGYANEHRLTVQGMAFSPSGNMLATFGDGAAIHLWDTASGRELLTKPEVHENNVARLAYSPDGRLLASAGSDHMICLWDVATGKPLRKLAGHAGGVWALAFSSDGKQLASCSEDDTARVWDVRTGTALHVFNEERKPHSEFHNFLVRAVRFTPDGKKLVAWGEDKILRIWDLDTGKEVLVRQVKLTSLPENTEDELLRPGQAFPNHRLYNAALMPDARTAVLESDSTFHLVDVATGRETASFARPQTLPALALSPDGQAAVTGGWDKAIRLWELATGKEILTITGLGLISAVAYSPDGRTLAAAEDLRHGEQASIRIFDVATGTQLTVFKGHDSSVLTLAFGSDGMTLASGQIDTTALIWDTAAVARRVARERRDLDEASLARLWAELAGGDAAKAHQASWALSADPAHTLKLMKQRLEPAHATDPRQIEQWIADLDSSKFAKRETAAQQLKKLGEEAEPAVRNASKGSPSPEASRRLQALLETPARWFVDQPETLRRLRSIPILERSASPDARLLLERLAQGAPAARETRLAKAALERLTMRASVKP